VVAGDRGTVAADAGPRTGAGRSDRATARLTGTVRSFNHDKGFGYISYPGGPDVLVAIQATGFCPLAEGDRVEFEIVQGPAGPRAVNVVKV
jgi:CspA family cold shock protein